MKIAAKLILVLLLGVFGFIVLAEYWALRHEDQKERENRAQLAKQLTETIAETVEEIWQSSGRLRALQILRKINQLNNERIVRVVYYDVTADDTDCPRIDPTRLLHHQTVATFSRWDEQGTEYLVTYNRLDVETRPAAIELHQPFLDAKENSQYAIWHALSLLGATSLLGAVLAFALGAAWIGRPMRQLIEKTRRIGQGDLSAPLALKRSDEFGELASALDSMCDQLHEAQDRARQEMTARVHALSQLRHADRLRTVGRLAAGIAHELGTPLNVISGRANLIASGRLAQDEVRDSALAIKGESDRIATIIRQLLNFARRSTPQRKPVNITHLVQQTLDLLGPIAERTHCRLRLADRPDTCLLAVDGNQIQQVLTNLVMNAVEAMPQGGEIEAAVVVQDAVPPKTPQTTPEPFLRIDIRDQGPGMLPEVQDHIFEPFFTTKEVGEGTGLGLSIAYGIVQDHDGWIEVSSEPGQGSLFSVFLPMGPEPCPADS